MRVISRTSRRTPTEVAPSGAGNSSPFSVSKRFLRNDFFGLADIVDSMAHRLISPRVESFLLTDCLEDRGLAGPFKPLIPRLNTSDTTLETPEWVRSCINNEVRSNYEATYLK